MKMVVEGAKNKWGRAVNFLQTPAVGCKGCCAVYPALRVTVPQAAFTMTEKLYP